MSNFIVAVKGVWLACGSVFCLMAQENSVWCVPSKRLLCLYSLQPQIVLGGTAQTTTLGTATAVQTATPQRTVQGTTATSTAATVRY